MSVKITCIIMLVTILFCFGFGELRYHSGGQTQVKMVQKESGVA